MELSAGWKHVSITLISTPKVLRNLLSFTSFYPVILPSPKIVWFPQVHRGKVGLWEGGDKWHMYGLEY